MEISKRLKETGIKPSKKFGQNFLVNEGIYTKIISALELNNSDVVVEVGPGLGTLTDKLTSIAKQIIAIEKDKSLIDYLKNHFKQKENVIIEAGDILKFNPENYGLKSGSYKLVGNIPYYLTSHLFKVVLDSRDNGWPPPKLVVFMLQKEVAQRIVAKPPSMSLLSVSVQYYAIPEIVSYVSAGSFYPAPKVDSAIIKLTIKNNIFEKHKEFFEVVHAGFGSKRKQLAVNLSDKLKISKEKISTILENLKIDPRRRAETVSLEEWKKITQNLYP